MNISTSLYDQRSFRAMSIPIQSADNRLSNRIIMILICFLQGLTWSDHLGIYLNARPHNDHIYASRHHQYYWLRMSRLRDFILHSADDNKTWCRFEFPSVIVSRNSDSHRFSSNYLSCCQLEMEDCCGMGLFIAAIGVSVTVSRYYPTGECRLGDLSPQKLRGIAGQ